MIFIKIKYMLKAATLIMVVTNSCRFEIEK